MRSGFRLHSRIAISEASILIEFTSKSATILMVESPAGLSFFSAAVHDVSYGSLFTAVELTASTPWLV